MPPKLLDYIKAEVTRGYQLELEEERFQARRDQVYMFLTIPQELERLMGYGFFQCADAFLFLFTYLPLRVAYKACCYISSCVKYIFKGSDAPVLRAADRCDLLKLFILIISVYLFTFIDTSVLYHVIKSQSVIKLYIFFNMLEVGDRLFASFVQDTIDALLLTATEESSKKSKSKTWGLTWHVILTIISVFGHALVILLQGTTLSVAINASNRALLTVMMSNNFVELKGAVFKKFDKINLFQVSCSDIRERFHLFILLLVVCLQTMREYSWEESRFWVLFPDCVIVLLSEVGVDWLKHAFITRFNEIPSEVYREYTLSLAYDLAQTKQRKAFSDHSDMVGRRLGFVPLPLAVVLARVLRPCINHGDIGTLLLTVLGFIALASFRTLNSIILLGKACDLIDQHLTVSAPPPSVQSPSHSQQPPSTIFSGNQTQTHVTESIKMEPVNDARTRTPSPNHTNFTLQHDHLPELRKPLEKRDSKIKFTRSYSASHTPRPSIGSINDLPPLPPLSSEYNDDQKLLQANSLVSILSVSFNEEMIANNEQMEAEQPSAPKLTRKHSLGSNLVDSEDVLSAQQTFEDVNIKIKSEPIEISNYYQDDESFSSFGSPGSDSVLEQTAFELEKFVVEEAQNSNLGKGDEFEKFENSTELSEIDKANINLPSTNSGSNEVRQRVKRKSITGWFKELGSSSKVNENNS